MIVDALVIFLKKDPLLKRNIVKTISWRMIGSFDTALISWLISGKLSIGIKIGIAEFITKLVIYYVHERFWQRSNFGLLSKRQQAQLIQKEIKPNLFRQAGRVNRQERERLNNNKSFTLWLTGLSGSGKSTLAVEIEEWIYKNDGRIYILDGDNTRLGINNDLSFSDEDRTENIRRVAEICRLFNDAGIIVISSFISPFEKDRLKAKKIIGEENFVEIYLEASVETCTKRDTKGLYKKAFEGKIKNFTGITSSYEPPSHSCLHLNTENTAVNECLDKVKALLSQRINMKEIHSD